MNALLNLKQAAEYTSLTPQTLRRLVWAERLPCRRGGGNRLYFEVADLDILKATTYPEGMSHTDIANLYGVSRGTVIYQFNRLRVQAIGRNRGGIYRTVYDPATVAKFARLLGWVANDAPPSPTGGALSRPRQNQTGESSAPAPATSTDD